jgi:hypothetical protein
MAPPAIVAADFLEAETSVTCPADVTADDWLVVIVTSSSRAVPRRGD